MKRVTLIVLCLSLITIVSHAQTSLFAYSSSWKYLGNGTDQGTAWRSAAFDDGAWSTGNGKFGYGLPGLQTVVSYGPNVNQKYITTYLRKAVNIPNPNAFSSFTAGVLRDDGKWWAVFATNAGTKVFRLDGSNWTDILTLATSSNSRADCKVVGNLVHILMFRGASTTSYLASLEYDAVNQTYKRWTQRTTNVNIVFEAGAVVILAMLENLSPNTAVGILATDPMPPPAYTSNPQTPLLPVTQVVENTLGVVGNVLNVTSGLLAKPNPFTSFTTVDFSMAKAGDYTVTLFDNNGMKIRELKQERAAAGLRNSIKIDGTTLPKGFYFITVTSGMKTQTFKLLKQ